MGIRDNRCDICGKYLDNRRDQPRMIEGKFMCKPCFDRMMAKERGEAVEEIEKKIDDTPILLMSTTANLEGYRITEQKGLVFGETVFKHSFLSSLGAGISNAIDMLSLRSTEMSGSVGLIEEARKFAFSKMMDDARARGANAIIGIESDNTIGGDIMYLSLYGTAVKVEPIPKEEKKEKDGE